MADGSVPVNVRMIIATWPEVSPRGAVTRFCAGNGISRSAFYAIRARAAREGPVAASVPRSRRPRSPAGQTAPAVEDLAVRIRKELVEDGWDAGPLSVLAVMTSQGLPAPSRATLARIFTRRGMVTAEPAKRPRSSWRRFAYAAPNELWQLDGTWWSLADGSPVMILQVLDDHSRTALASLAALTENADAARAVVDTAIARAGVPQRFLTDNGTAYNLSRRGKSSALERHLHSLGVHTIAASPYHPQTCGKNERVHATLKKWLAARPHPTDLPALQALLDEFDEHYNTVRVHQALAGLTPRQAWDATPIAAAPTPPTPTQDHTPTTRTRARTNKVAANGNVGAGGVIVQVGTTHAGERVHVLTDGPNITILDTHGAVLRTVQRVPGRTYYGNGQPRGRRRTTTPSTM